MKILAAALICVLALPAAAETLTGIVHPTDGDTWFLVMPEGTTPRRIKIRPDAIDAPELGQRCTRDGKPWYPGWDSGRWLTGFVDGKPVTCTTTGKKSYGRFIATCTVDGKSLQEAIVRAGWAFDYSKYSNGRFAAVEEEAKSGRRGIHAGHCEKPWVWRHKRR